MGRQKIKYFFYAGRVAGNVKFALKSPRSKSRASQKKKKTKNECHILTTILMQTSNVYSFLATPSIFKKEMLIGPME